MSGLSDTKTLLVILGFLGIILFSTIVPNVFTIDEVHNLVSVLALREGRFSVPGTENLSPSKELAYFDPFPEFRTIASTPVFPRVPPLYAFLALPFSLAGWHGLVLVNLLAYLGAGLVVFLMARQASEQRSTPWIASVLFLLGGYCMEYAQGVWPHMLSAFLCTFGLFLTRRILENGTAGVAVLQGLLMGTAVGVRQQNIFLAGCLGLAILALGKKRVVSSLAYALGVAVPILLISLINLSRFDSFHPFPKLTEYVTAVGLSVSSGHPFSSFWAKVVDFSVFDASVEPFYRRDPSSGVIFVNGVIKKSWMQSVPWVGLSIVGLFHSWFVRREKVQSQQRQIRLLSFFALPTLVMFSLPGFGTTDGLSFNQRYFLEIFPAAAVAAALMFDKVKLQPLHSVVGMVMGALLVIVLLNMPAVSVGHAGQLRLPILLAGALIAVFYLSQNHKLQNAMLGMCFGWAMVVHLGTDMQGSRERREDNLIRFEILNKVVPNHSALFTYWGNKDAAGPLQFDRDVVILDLRADKGRDAPRLTDELLAKNRRVFLLVTGVPGEILDNLVGDRNIRRFSESYMNFIEILGPPHATQ